MATVLLVYRTRTTRSSMVRTWPKRGRGWPVAGRVRATVPTHTVMGDNGAACRFKELRKSEQAPGRGWALRPEQREQQRQYREFTACWEACYNGHTSAVAKLLDRTPDHHTTPFDKPGLPYTDAWAVAAKRGHMDIVALLLDRRIQIATNLMYSAVKGRHTDIVALLLDHDADAHKSALYHGITQGQESIVAFVLNRGVVDAHTLTHGRQPLDLAVTFRHKNIVALLLDRGADINAEILQTAFLMRPTSRICPEYLSIESMLRGHSRTEEAVFLSRRRARPPSPHTPWRGRIKPESDSVSIHGVSLSHSHTHSDIHSRWTLDLDGHVI
eukprot:COSAG02_NODE_16193_length_1105_cov_6.158052_1_plen_328_part_00